MARQRMTQRELAEKLRLPQPSISKRLSGDIAFNTKELAQVAAALGVPVAQFMPDAGSGPTHPGPSHPGGPTSPPSPTPPPRQFTQAAEAAASAGKS